MSKAKQAQLNLRIPPYVAAYTEPYQSVSEKYEWQISSDIAHISQIRSKLCETFLQCCYVSMTLLYYTFNIQSTEK